MVYGVVGGVMHWNNVVDGVMHWYGVVDVIGSSSGVDVACGIMAVSSPSPTAALHLSS